MKLATAEQMREIDRIAIEERGVPGIELMRQAGHAVARAVLEIYEPDAVAIVTGKGNNAGDGFVVASELHACGVAVTVFLFDDPDNLRGDAALAYADFAKLLWSGTDAQAPAAECCPREILLADSNSLASQLSHYDIIVDALFGTGLRGPLEGSWSNVISALNDSGMPIVSIDIPSGLPAEPIQIQETGQRSIIHAARTVTIGLPKLGLFTGAGVVYRGVVSIEAINFPADLLENPAITINLTTKEEARALLPRRNPAGHKGTFGKVLLAAGSGGMTGAAVLAARAAARSGAGLVYCAYPESLSTIMESHLIEPVKIPLAGACAARWFTMENINELLAHATGMQAMGVGPGLGCRPETGEFLKVLIRNIKAPMVIDADGLNLLSEFPDELKQRPGPTILTPHPGEAARLLEKKTSEIEDDRLGAFVDFAKDYDCIVVLKGAQTVITLPDGQRWVNSTGGSGLAKGGSGDVLTGLLTGLLGQGMQPADATRLGVFLHGLAGDLAAQKLSPRAMLASDVIDNLGEAFTELESELRN